MYWHNPEDIGIAIGIYAKTFSQLTLDEIEPIREDWFCPDEFIIDRATYDDWKIGTW